MKGSDFRLPEFVYEIERSMPKSKFLRHFRKNFSNWSRPLRHALTLPVLNSFQKSAQWMPYGMGLWLGKWLGWLVWKCRIRQRGIAERQLLETGVAKMPSEAKAISRALFMDLGMNLFEWMHSMQWDLETLSSHVDVEGVAGVMDAAAFGRGVIFTPLHMGLWEVMMRMTYAHTKLDLTAVLAETSNPKLTQWLCHSRQCKEGFKLLLAQSAMMGLIRSLRKGGGIALLNDQDTTRGRGIFVEFFGRPAYTPIGPAFFSIRTGAPLIVASNRRDPQDPRRHKMRFEPPIFPQRDFLDDPTLTSERKAELEELEIARLTQICASMQEAIIRQDPASWVWFHRRWRHQPGKRIRIRSAGG